MQSHDHAARRPDSAIAALVQRRDDLNRQHKSLQERQTIMMRDLASVDERLSGFAMEIVELEEAIETLSKEPSEDSDPAG